jgi:aryl-alcohol dehydrogenase-like predicted oxidoreductase
VPGKTLMASSDDRKRRIGTLVTGPLILGGNVFGWTVDRDGAFRVLDAFYAGGGRVIDTADLYERDLGASEVIIGDWMRLRGRRKDVIVTTKVGMMPGPGGEGLAPGRIEAAAASSLARLQTDYIDLYLAHCDDLAQDQRVVAAAFDQLVKSGRVREIGASNFSADRLASAISAQDETGCARYVALQNSYSLMDRTLEGETIVFCQREHVGVTPYYALANGYLTGKYRTMADLKGRARDGAAARYMKAGGDRVLAALDHVAEDIGASLAQISLAWLCAQPGVVAPIASATTTAQIEELLHAGDIRLTDAQCRILAEASASCRGPA